MEYGDSFYRVSGTREELLVKHGFINPEHKGEYIFDDEKDVYVRKDGKNIIGSHAHIEEAEILKGRFDPTGFPPPLKNCRLMWELYDLSLESPYFWILEQLKRQFPMVHKLEDSFAAAENSAFFGVTQQRLGGQQDKVSQFLATAGKMIKELFQMVRELRILDERLLYYNKVADETEKPIGDRAKNNSITLKGMFVDLVQGGSKSAASVYGMAQNLEFITLPDLFFDAPPFKNDLEIEQHIKNLGKDFNRNVLRVLSRHFTQFKVWRERTHKEHQNRKDFQLRYLWQHFEVIRMYLEWVKPYLRNVSKLSMKRKTLNSAEIISAFEGSVLDIEIMAQKPKGNGANSCVLVSFNYRTRPELKVVQEGYQRGPVHIGKMEMTIRGYAWSDKQIDMYQKMKEREIIALMGDVSTSVHKAMISLGDELEKYLKEAKDTLEGKKKDKEKIVKESKKKVSLMKKLLGDLYTPEEVKIAKPPRKKVKEEKEKEEKLQASLKEAEEEAINSCWFTYHLFKKAHRLIAW